MNATNEKELITVGITVSIIIALATSLTGCGVVDNFEMWHGGPRIEFGHGVDLGAHMNGIDNVSDHRGLTFQPKAK